MCKKWIKLKPKVKQKCDEKGTEYNVGHYYSEGVDFPRIMSIDLFHFNLSTFLPFRELKIKNNPPKAHLYQQTDD